MKKTKNVSILLLLSLFTFLASCTKEDTTIDKTSVENDGLVAESNLLNGNQRINPNQTDGSLIRGVGVSIPIFSQETVEVPAGSWITITFSLQDIVNIGPCQGPLTQAQVTSIIDDSALFITENGFEISFDDDQIDILTHLRADEITTVINNNGDCQYILPFRYYVRPKSVGSHTLSTVLQGVEFSRQVIWVPRN